MIVKVFDNGWRNEFLAKQYENNVVNELVKNITIDRSKSVIINSVWYTNDYHQTVLKKLKCLDFNQIILVAMLDAAIPHPEWYNEFDCKVIPIGYYPSNNKLDFWALFFNKFSKPVDHNILLDHTSIDCAYMCLNRKPHWHRKKLYNSLVSLNINSLGIVSMGSNTDVAIQVLTTDTDHDELAPNATKDHHGIPNDIASLGHLGNWTKSFLNVVTETFYDINRTHFVSEKIYKPIVGLRPFLVYDPDGAVKWLTDRQFEPYVDDFYDISDLNLTAPDNIPYFLKELCNQPPAYWQKKFVDLREKLLYNRNRFLQYVQEQQYIIQQGISCQI
jgi:hypothetical protein